MNYLTFNELTSEEKVLFLAFCRIDAKLREGPGPLMSDLLQPENCLETNWECFCNSKSPYGYELPLGTYFKIVFSDLIKSIVLNYLIIKNDNCDILIYDSYFSPYDDALTRNIYRLINEIKDSDQLKNLYICNVNYPKGKYIKFYYYELPEKNMMINKNVKELIAHNVDETIVTSVIVDLIAWHILKEDYEIKFHYNFANLAPELATRIIADAKMMYESLK